MIVVSEPIDITKLAPYLNELVGQGADIMHFIDQGCNAYRVIYKAPHPLKEALHGTEAALETPRTSDRKGKKPR